MKRILFLILSVLTHFANAQLVDTSLWSTDGSINAILQNNDTIYVGGSFSHIVPNIPYATIFDTVSGSPDATLPRFDNYVGTAVGDGNKGWYVGGGFNTYGSIPCRGFAHLDSVGSLVPMNLYVAGAVSAIVKRGSRIFLGGAFSYIGRPTGGGGVLDTTNGVLREALSPPVEGWVYTVVSDGTGGWYIGGRFTSVGNSPRSNLARIDAAGNVTSWAPMVAGGNVRTMIISGQTLYLAGTFTAINSQQRDGLASIDLSTGTVTSWAPAPDSTVSVIEAYNGKIYVGGLFSNIGGQQRDYLAALDPISGLASAWNPDPNQEVVALAFSGNKVYAGGKFTTIGGQIRNHIATVDITTGAATPWNPNASSVVFAICLAGSRVYTGGQFNTIGGQSRSNLAALDTVTGLATTWTPNPIGSVSRIKVFGARLYILGMFGSTSGQFRSGVASYKLSNNLLTSWNPRVTGLNSNIPLDFASYNDNIYLGGAFESTGGAMRANLAEIDSATAAVTAWNPGADANVHSVAAGDSILYVGGMFHNIGGQPRNYLASLSMTSGNALPFNPDPNWYVFDIEVDSSNIYFRGTFTTVSGQSRMRVASVNRYSGSLRPWTPLPNGAVQDILLSGGTLYATGSFTTFGGQSRTFAACVDTVLGNATSWNPVSLSSLFLPYGGGQMAVMANSILISEAVGNNGGGRLISLDKNTAALTSTISTSVIGGDIQTILPVGRVFYAGGAYTAIGGVERNNIAAIDAVTGNVLSWNPDCTGNSVRSLWYDNGALFFGGDFTAVSQQPRNSLAAVSTTTGGLLPWDPDAAGVINCMIRDGQSIYIGGSFTSVGSQPRTHIAAVDITSGLPGPWAPALDQAPVNAMDISGGILYLGGNFNTVNQQAYPKLASFDLATGNLLNWSPAPDGLVSSIVCNGGVLYAGGRFNNMGTQSRSNLAQLDIATGIANAWNPGTNDTVKCIVNAGDRIYIGGTFTSVGGQGRTRIASIDAINGSVSPWNPGSNYNVLAISMQSQGLLAGGQFSLIGTKVRKGLARLAPDEFNKITGEVFMDANNNNLHDAGEYPITGALIVIQPGNGMVMTDTLGKYKSFVSPGTYSITPVLLPYMTSVAPNAHAAVLTSLQTDSLNDFAWYMPLFKDMRISVVNMTLPRPGFNQHYRITYKNKGTYVMSGTVQLIKDTLLVYNSSVPSASSVSGDTLQWSFVNLNPNEQRVIHVQMNVVPGATPWNSVMNSFAEISPVAGDTFPQDNTYTLHEIVQGSYDPNCKTVYPGDSIIPNQTGALEYVIRFQNTGTDTAFTVMLTDTIDMSLNIQSINVLSSSHAYTCTVQGRTVKWVFNNILLPDSNVNEPGSHGFVQYRISPNSNLPQGTVISNTANIFFDYNPAVITNTEQSILLDLLVGQEETPREVLSTVEVYPNPFNEQTTFVLSNSTGCACTLEIIDQLGRIIDTKVMMGNSIQYEIKNKGKAMYYYRLVDKERAIIANGKLITY